MKTLLTIYLFFIATGIFANDFTIKGYVRDAATGEELIGAVIYIKEIKSGTVTNIYGFYSVTLPQGKYSMSISFLGYKQELKEIDLRKNQTLNINLTSFEHSIDEVKISAKRKDENVVSLEMSINKLQMKTIKTLPMLMGEVDVLKAIQLLPGVQNGGEGTTGFYVRGGGVDQNLILLDDAPVYNASHVGGVFSVFNGDVLKDVTLYKGGIPSEYGGRLSSVLDIRMKEGNMKRFSSSGGIGILSSRLNIEGPLIKDKCSFILSGRRSYVDLFFPFMKDTAMHGAKVFFHDFNTKINYIVNDKNRIFISGYFGRDVISPSKEFKMSYGNTTATVRWNHLFSDKLFSNFIFIGSNFDYNLGVPEGAQAFNWKANIIDFSFKNNYTYYLNTDNTIKAGVSTTLHKFKPGQVESIGDSFFNFPNLPDNHALEHGVFLSNQQKINHSLSVEYGLRFSAFQNIGKSVYYKYNSEHIMVDSTIYKTGEIYNTYTNLEPRLNIRYQINSKSSIKASYNRMTQYIHLATNSTAATPLDVWFPSSPNIPPQKADQFVIGYFRNFYDNRFELSVESYYKKMHNAIDFKDHANLILEQHIEGEMRIGDAESYGLELLLKKETGKLTGWVSYTLSKTTREIPEINDGKPYAAPYDKTHDFAFVASYDIGKRVNIAGNWIYTTASPITVPTGRFEYNGMIAPVYSDRNTVRLFDYHRLDLSVTIYSKSADKKRPKRNGKPRKNFKSNWNFSVYNVYVRKNPYSITFKQVDGEGYETEAEMLYLFKALPSVTYNFSF